MASSSLSCSSGSPSASTVAQATDLQDSDDSGVDLKPQIGHFLQRFSTLDHVSSRGRRNKRKSSEPRKRKDVLLMKRFRWDDTDDEDNREEEEDNDDVFDDLEGERPSSGDSGFREVQETPTRTHLSSSPEKKTRPRQWRKPKTEAIVPEEEGDSPAPTTPFRQSVICKNEAGTTPPSTSTTTLLQQRGTPIDSTVTSAKISLDKKLYSDPLLSDHDVSDDPEGGRAVESRCRPRNYKSMSRQRRIEANARERTRVHTISAAFESLRRAVPAYAHNQKLSKLAILRIASAYIVALACLNGGSGATEGAPSSMTDCVERCTRTIQAEGRSRRRTPSTKD